MRKPYAGYDVLSKWNSPSFNEVTREALARRLAPLDAPRFLDEDQFRLLEAVVARLYPQDDRPEPIPLAAWIDQRLANGQGQGYRREDTPCEDQAWRIGLAGIDGEARWRFGREFAALDPAEQDVVLHAVQAGSVNADHWPGLDPGRFFRDTLLRAVAALAYGHPIGWNEIGFGGPASPRGYVRLGIDERDPWEAKEQPG